MLTSSCSLVAGLPGGNHVWGSSHPMPTPHAHTGTAGCAPCQQHTQWCLHRCLHGAGRNTCALTASMPPMTCNTPILLDSSAPGLAGAHLHLGRAIAPHDV
eukprot:360029-Chlamydomonas_euryale.AAC.4